MDYLINAISLMSQASLSECVGWLILFSVAIALIQLGFRFPLDKKTMKECHEIGGHIFATAGTLYAVVLGLFVYDAQNLYGNHLEWIITESTAISTLYSDAHEIPKPESDLIKNGLRQYVNRVIEYEWSSLSASIRDEEARRALIDVSIAVRRVTPINDKQMVLYDKMNDLLGPIWESRSKRIYESEKNIPRLEWAVLFIGAGITLLLGFFFTMENLILQIIFDFLLALMMALNIYVIAEFRNPYAGEVILTKEPFKRTQNYMAMDP